MSDNPFAELLDAFASGWKTAGKIDFTPSQRVRSRPSFWNPFLTWRDAERQQLHALFNEVRAAFDASPFASAEFLERTVDQVTLSACQAVGVAPPPETLGAMHAAIAPLVEGGFFSFYAVGNDDWFRNIGIEDASRLKRDFERKRRFLNDAEKLFEIGCRRLSFIFAILLDFFPESLRHHDSAETESGSLKFDADLVDLINDPVAAIEGTLTALFEKDVRDAELYEDVCEQLEHNLYVASGLNPKDKAVSHKQLILPSETNWQTPAELAARYLKETPFADFFAYPLPLHISQEARFEHCHILGGTGHGKTQCIQYLLLDDLIHAAQYKSSIVVIDSQGDLIRKITLSRLFAPEDDTLLADRLILIDPADIDHPPALNLFDPGLDRLKSCSPRDRELAFNSLVDIYGRFFGALLGAELTARQNTVFRYLARLMLTIEGATVHTLIALMDDIGPFKGHIERLDPTARRFFENEFSKKGFYATRQQIKQRLYAVLSIPTFDRLFSAPRSKVDFFHALNSGSIVLVNTAKDLLKSDGTAIFGRFILALIEHAVMERAMIPEDERVPVFLYMDEAQDYFDDTVETLLVQARKHRCGLVLAHQNLAQLSPRLRSIFMGNSTIKLAGGVTDGDARSIAADMRATPEFLLSMKKQKETSEFALSVRNQTSHALKIRIPLGFLESLSVLEPDQHAALLERSRRRIGYVPVTENHRETPAPTSPEHAPATAPEPETPHRTLQIRIKRAAQQCGFAAAIEKPTEGGTGRIDVALERDGLQIAVEVSATTKPDHERHNIEKCIAAGFDEVWLTSPDEAQLNTLRTALLPTFTPAIRDRVLFLSQDGIVARLRTLTEEVPAGQSTVLGYAVEIVHTWLGRPQTKDRRERLSNVLRNARRNNRRNVDRRS